MASVKYGVIVTEIKGKVGGTTFKGGLGAPCMQTTIDGVRDSAKLTKADAGRVINTLTLTAEIAGEWRKLTDAQRESWRTGAVNYPSYNKFGSAYTPSGYQVFMTLNFQVRIGAGAIISTCPVPISVPAITDFAIAQPDLTSLDLTWSIGLPSLYFTKIEATQPMAKGNQPKNSYFKAIKLLSDAATSPYDLFPDYANIYGSFPANAMIYFRFTYISATTGQKGVPFVIALLTT